jgi:calcium-translocating P-type ATPase
MSLPYFSPMKNYQTTQEQLFAELQTSLRGLSTTEASHRQQKNGKNIIPKAQRIALWQIVLHQFTNPLIYVLIVAGGVSFFIDEELDAFFIFAIITINACIGAYQEWKAEKNAEALQEFMRIQATAKRENEVLRIDAEELVVGDIVLLESGNRVPADIRLIQTNQLSIEEAILTGESVAVHKNEGVLLIDDLPLAERINMAYAGTTVTSGRGIGVVTEIGSHTEIGKIAHALTQTEAATMPLVERMEGFTQKISIATLAICFLIGLLGWLSGVSLFTIFLFVIALAVSAIPEGLPIALTVALSVGTLRMARKNVIIRQLNAVEGLGSCTFIATDKTGTLTADQQTVKKIILANGTKIEISGQGYNGEGTVQLPTDEYHVKKTLQLIKSAVYCNEAHLTQENKKWVHSGDAVDVALLAVAYKAQLSPEELRKSIKTVLEIPFESERKFAAKFFQYQPAHEVHIAVKGAVEEIAKRCQNIDYQVIEQQVKQLTQEGFRVIAVAQGFVHSAIPALDESQIKDLELLGLVGLIDPVRPEVPQAIADCHRAGVVVAMVTGDHPQTALAIAQQIGIAQHENEVITGKVLSQCADSNALHEAIKDKKVFARVSPQQKQQIVQALKDLGHFVAVTGDGVNDAPALRTANIGVAMGYGTDIAKDTASIIVADNNFASIAKGIAEGRLIYSNLRKVIYLLISTGFAELFVVVLALFFNMPLPFVAVQLLWLNLVTNGIQDISLAFEQATGDLMQEAPRKPQEGVFNRLMIEQVFLSGIFTGLIVFVAWYYLLHYLNFSETAARNICLLLMVCIENFHVLNCRSETSSTFKIPFSNNWTLVGGTLLAQGIHIAAMHIPFLAEILQVAPVDFMTWGYTLLAASSILWLMEGYKWLRKKLL